MAEYSNMARELVPGIEALLRARINEATDEVVRQATVEFENRLRQAITTSALDISTFFDLERTERGVVITVKDVRKR